MKSGTIAVTLAGLVVVAGIAYAFVRNAGDAVVSETPAKSELSGEAVHVDDLGDNPEKFKGEIVLRAVVSAVKETEGVFAVIDSREYESCGVLTCAKHNLPVKFGGEAPAPRTVVEITGEVVKSDKGLVFAARRVDP
ncbi:MAG: hypothetical protein JSU86_14910, partial [Phycisphaerales bacterium]